MIENLQEKYQGFSRRRLPRCGLDVYALQQEPGDAHGHRGDPKERPLAAGRFDEEARDAGPHHGGRLHGHRRQAGVRAKLRVRTEVEHQGEDIDQHERAAEPGHPEDYGIGPGRGHPLPLPGMGDTLR